MDLMHLLNAFAVGLAAGLIFYGGLWLTVRSLSRVGQPGLLFFLSFLARSSASLALLWFVAGPGWRGLAAAVLGMLLVRLALTRHLGPPKASVGATDRTGE